MMKSRQISWDGLKLAYVEQLPKSPQGPTVVFLHSNSVSSASFQKQFETERLPGRLKQSRLLALDLPGHGDSDRLPPEKKYTYRELVNAVAFALEKLSLTESVLVGHSIGGHLALALASLFPSLRGILITGTPPLSNPPRMEDAFLPSPATPLIFKPDLTDEEIQLWMRESFNHSDDIFPLFSELVRKSDPRFRSGLVESVGALDYRDEVEIARSLTMPFAIIQGEKERLISTSYIQSLNLTGLWKNSVQAIPDAGHWSHWEKPEIFNRILAEYLESTDSARI